MLILSRRVNERINIGGDIEVAVVEIRGDQVKLGIVAPRHVKVHRHEVFQAIEAENRAAAAAGTDLSGLSSLVGEVAPPPADAPRPDSTA